MNSRQRRKLRRHNARHNLFGIPPSYGLFKGFAYDASKAPNWDEVMAKVQKSVHEHIENSTLHQPMILYSSTWLEKVKDSHPDMYELLK